MYSLESKSNRQKPKIMLGTTSVRYFEGDLLSPHLVRHLARILRSLGCGLVTTIMLLVIVTPSYSVEPAPSVPGNISPQLRLLIARTLSTDATQRRDAARELGKMGTDASPAIPFLIYMKLNDTEELRSEAIDVLGSLGDAVVLPLIDHLKTCHSSKHRADIAGDLGVLGDRRAVETLIALLKDHDPDVRRWAASGLTFIPDSRSLEPLLACAKSDSIRDVREVAVNALAQLRDARAADLFLGMLKNDKDSGIRIMAAYGLARLGDSRAFEPIVANLESAIANDDRGGTISHMACALGELRDARARDILTRVLMNRKRNQETRSDAAFALGKLNDGRVADALVTVWHDSTERRYVRLAAATSLGQTRDHRAIDALKFAIEDGCYPWGYRAVQLLGKIHDPRAKAIVKQAFEHPRGIGVRSAASLVIKEDEFAKELDEAFPFPM
jgi:HEAT repeat protein